MKSVLQVASCCLLLFLCGQFFSCNKNDPPPDPVDPGSGASNADTISNHLQFWNATKKTGSIPRGPAGSTLMISFKDTLYLNDEIARPIKFLHEDTTKNV